MPGLTHKQAKRYMLADLDGLLRADERRALQAHLDSCPACLSDSRSFTKLTSRLQTELHARRDDYDGPSNNVLNTIRSQTRRIQMQKRIDTAFNLFGGAVTIAVLAFLAISVISQFQKKSTPATNETQISAPAQQEPLIAFVITQDYVNGEIYTMKSDGSDLTNITNNPATDESPAWSPDGTQIAFVSDRSGGRDIYIMNPDGSYVRKLTDSATFNDHFLWSPDGKKIAYISSGSNEGSFPGTDQLMVMNPDGSNKIALTGQGSFMILGWSPDGQKIVYQIPNPGHNAESSIMIANVDGTGTIDGIVGIDFGFPQQIQWEAPDRFVISSYNFNTEPSAWQISRVFVTTDTTVYNGFNPMLVTTAKPIVAIFERTYIAEDQDALRWFAFDGAPIPMSPWYFPNECDTPQRSDPALQDTFHTIAPDSQQAFVVLYCKEGVRFFHENADGTKVQQLDKSLASPAQVTGAEWSPDGRHVLVTVVSNKGTELYRFDIQEMLNNPTIQPAQLAVDSAMIYGAVWEPIVNNDIVEEKPTQKDNRLIAFTSEVDGNAEIYTVYANGSNATNLTNNPANDMNPVWSPDGQHIAFESNRNGQRQIFLMNADGSQITQLDRNDNKESVDQWIGEPYNLNLNLWSPDGKRLVFLEIIPGKDNGILYLIDANGENKKPLTREAGAYRSPAWSPDGKHIAFISLENNVARIYVTDVNGNNLSNVTKSLPPDMTLYPEHYSWASDGQSISFIASNWNNRLGGGGDPSSNYQWTAYEANLDGSSLTVRASAKSQIGGYWDGTYFLAGSAAVSASPAYTWVRSDGTITTANPIKDCQQLLDSNTGGYILGFSTYKQSSNGNVIIGAYCPNGDKWLFWADSIGTYKPLLSAPIHMESIPSNAMYLWSPADFIWSPDDTYVAFNLFDPGKTDMYIVNVADALNTPSLQPIHITIGDGNLYYSPVWRPITNEDLTENNPTPEPQTFNLTLSQAKTLAGFHVLEPSSVPAGFTLLGAAYNSQTGNVILRYTSAEQGILDIYQQRGTLTSDPALQTYINPVTVSGNYGEYLRGAWVYDTPNTTQPRFDPNAAAYSLTWENADMLYSIIFIGGDAILPLQLADLLEIAESLK